MALGEIVVTATRFEEDVREVPAQITVIDREDIQKSTAGNVLDLLSAEGGLVTRGFSGNEKKAAVDIRGMGETSVSSVLVLVDGVRVNPADMGGPDLSSIALDQVERIEIVRGAGTVLYGNGAVGGVVNIITSPPGGQPLVNVKAGAGSFGTSRATVCLRKSLDRLHLTVLGNRETTEGYRENGRFNNRNLETKAAADLSDCLTLTGRIRLHRDTYGFPGPLTYEQFEQDPRQSMDDTGSKGETADDTQAVGLSAHLGDMGVFTAACTFGERKNTWTMLRTPGEITERTREDNVGHKWDRACHGHRNQHPTGCDYRTPIIPRRHPLRGSHSTRLTRSLPHGQALYSDRWIIQAGARRHAYVTEQRTTGEEENFRSTDWTAGLIAGSARRRDGPERVRELCPSSAYPTWTSWASPPTS